MDTLRSKMNAKKTSPVAWSKPDSFDLGDRADRREVERRIDAGSIAAVIDRHAEIADDLFEMRYPALKDDESSRTDFIDDVRTKGESFGRWFHFPWNASLVRYPDQTDHQELRSFRNKNLVTNEEQRRLLGAHAVIFGLSVGSNVLEQLVSGGVGGSYTIGDFDRLSVTNLNRIRAGVPQVGMSKIDIAAIKISELDPYVEQRHFRQGVTEDVLEELSEHRPDIVFDEVDDLAMKALLRRFAAINRVPLLMATDIADTSLLDVERYDLDEKTKPFHGKLKDADIEKLLSGDMTDAERKKLMIKIVGLKHITPRMLDSAMKTGQTLGGLPQLGATAALGGALSAVAARELLLGRKLDTGRYESRMRKTLNLQHVTPVRQGIRTAVSFARQTK